MFLLAPAFAHVPHDTVRALAAPPALDAEAPWFAVADPQDVHLLLRSDDAGGHWRMVGGAPTMDTLSDAAGLAEGVSVLLGPVRYWWSGDGETWSAGELPGDVHLLAAAGSDLLLGGAGGVWQGRPGEVLTRGLAVAVVALGEGGVAVDETGRVWRLEDGGTWEELGAPGPLVLAAVDDGADVYAGADDGSVWRRDTDGWVACGALPPDDTGLWPQVVGLAADGGTLLAAAAWRAPFASVDRCETWEDRDVGDDTQFGASGGGAEGVGDAWTVLDAENGRWVVGGWAGLYESEDAGASWTTTSIVPADYTRGLAFSPDFDVDHRVFVGGYGAGPLRTEDGGVTLAATHTEGIEPNVQRMDLADAPADAASVYAVIGHTGWTSGDAGVTWSRFSPFDTVGDFVVWESRDHVWAITGDGGIAETLDGGENWTTLDALDEALAPSRPQGTGAFRDADGVDHACVSGSAPSVLVCTTDDGPWTTWYTGTGLTTTDPVGWPPGAATRVLIADDQGLHVTDDAGGHWADTDPTSGDPIEVMVQADDGTLFLATRSAQLWRSDDGGGQWTAQGDRLTAHIYVLTTRPRFEVHPDVLVGTHDGMWLAHGDDAPVRWAAYQRLDTQGALLPCTACPGVQARDDAGMGGVQPLSAGARLDGWVRGATIRVIGSSTTNGRGALYVDGDRLPFGSVDEPGIGTLVEANVAEGWHAVAVEAASPGISVDAIEGIGASTALAFDEPDTGDDSGDPADSAGDDTGGDGPPGRRCLCAGGSRAHLVLLGWLVLARRRRRP